MLFVKGDVDLFMGVVMVIVIWFWDSDVGEVILNVNGMLMEIFYWMVFSWKGGD